MSEFSIEPKAPLEPLFTLNLGENGGTLAPTSVADLITWIQNEQGFWSLVMPRELGNHERRIRESITQINHALNAATQAQQVQAGDLERLKQQLNNCQSHLSSCYLQSKLPHSSTPIAVQIEEYRKDAGAEATSFFAAALLDAQESLPYQPQKLSAWRGFMEGLAARYNSYSSIPKGRKQAADKSFEQLRAKAETLLGEKTEAFNGLHRSFSEISDAIQSSSKVQTELFEKSQLERSEVFEKLVQTHQQEMENLRRVFREGMALREPVNYWRDKKAGHLLGAAVTGTLSFVGMAVAATVIGYQIHDVLMNTPRGQAPETWRLSVMVLIGLFAVWALRLVVRMFLSHLHLHTDAGERVVMVQTYLSLMEGDQLAEKADRQLILQALFRQSSDGLVKDEGIPPSFLEFLTRSSKP